MWGWERGKTGVQPLPAVSQGGSQRGEQIYIYFFFIIQRNARAKRLYKETSQGETDRQEDRETGQIDSAGP